MADGRGRHGNHARGSAHPKWKAGGRLTTSQGYIAVRVPIDHPHAWGPDTCSGYRYAYEHVVVMMAKLGRPLTHGELVHHKNEVRSDNSPDNLELMQKSAHSAHHVEERDTRGRFTID